RRIAIEAGTRGAQADLLRRAHVWRPARRDAARRAAARAMTPRIATVVHGRFYAFDLVRALLQRGVAATLFTNYPPQVARRFGIDAASVRSNLLHGVASRVLRKLHAHSVFPDPEPILHPAFSKWAARAVAGEKQRFDVVQCFSGVAEELFRSLPGSPLRILV